jgi:signal transduction histidine kinase
LFGLLLAGLPLLVIQAGSVVVTVLGLTQLLQFGPGSPDGGRDLLAVAVGLAALRFAVPWTLLGARRLAMLTRHLAGTWCGVPIASAYLPPPAGRRAGRLPGTTRLSYQQQMGWLLGDVATWRDLAWLAVGAVVGAALLLVPVALCAAGLAGFVVPALARAAGSRGPIPPPAFPGNGPVVLLAIGVAFACLGLWSAPRLLRGYGMLARLMLAPSEEAALALRVEHLAQTRRETLDTGAAELRRIERDLHDGAQARLVAMGLTLDAAGRLIDTDPAGARALLYEARDASVKALTELRDLVRGIHPPVLADRGLAEAVRALALDAPLPVRVTGSLPGRVPAPVESAAYFAVSELLANVAKHADARAAEADLRYERGALRISVRDDGQGGAESSRGSGLSGIGRRLAAFDGVLVIDSPAGGPTVITMEIPCELS